VATGLFDPAALAGYPSIVFLVVGLALTAVIQSSSATIMITLSALYVGAIPLASAAAVAIGADLGTTVTALLGALAGSAAKKRVAAALVIFNVVTDALAFVFLKPLLALITDVAGIGDPLFALVAFHSLFNLIGILLFLPLTGRLSTRLDRAFMEEGAPLLRHIKDVDRAVPEAAIENISHETFRLLDQAAALNQVTFGLPPDYTFYDAREDRIDVDLFGRDPDYDHCYAEIKELEGAILTHALALQSAPLEPPESERLGQLIPAIRNAVHAAKSMRDIHSDLRLFLESLNDRFNAYYDQFREAERDFYETVDTLRDTELPSLRFEALVNLQRKAEELHARMHRRIYDEVHRAELSQVEISTLLNVNRELYISHQSLISALADALLDMASARDFASIPTRGR
jgi:phosphate:Na+ symporter